MKKLALLILALGAVAVATLTAPPAAEAACKKLCCLGLDGPCYICCTTPCPIIVCPG